MRIKKITIFVFIVIILLGNICRPSYAAHVESTDGGGSSGSGVSIGGLDIGAFKPGTLTGDDTEKAFSLGKTIISGLTVIGVIISVLMVMVLGIKYMVGSIEQKAEYKKTMVPMLIGAILIFASSLIVSIFYDLIYTGILLKG